MIRYGHDRMIQDTSTHVGGAMHAETLVVEAVHLRDLPALVVSARQRDAVGVANLQRNLRTCKCLCVRVCMCVCACVFVCVCACT
jgi:hypothetical protein